MPRVRVRMFATIREAARVSETEVEAGSVKEVLTVLKSVFGRRMRIVLEQAENDPDKIVVLLNGVNVPVDSGSKTSLRDGDEVSIFPPVSGG
ncbi:MAG: MoaD family protein [Thermoplasmata archaeon]|jgi:MoaD family protein|nr:MoaD family protein [Thermoplasmata archaeon]